MEKNSLYYTKKFLRILYDEDLKYIQRYGFTDGLLEANIKKELVTVLLKQPCNT